MFPRNGRDDKYGLGGNADIESVGFVVVVVVMVLIVLNASGAVLAFDAEDVCRPRVVNGVALVVTGIVVNAWVPTTKAETRSNHRSDGWSPFHRFSVEVLLFRQLIVFFSKSVSQSSNQASKQAKRWSAVQRRGPLRLDSKSHGD